MCNHDCHQKDFYLFASIQIHNDLLLHSHRINLYWSFTNGIIREIGIVRQLCTKIFVYGASRVVTKIKNREAEVIHMQKGTKFRDHRFQELY